MADDGGDSSLRELGDLLLRLEIESGLYLRRIDAALAEENAATPLGRLHAALSLSRGLADESARVRAQSIHGIATARWSRRPSQEQAGGEPASSLRRDRQRRQLVRRPGNDAAA